jgi:hypothetical protein
MKQLDENFTEENNGNCPNCKHNLKIHSKKELAECTIAFLKSDIKI